MLRAVLRVTAASVGGVVALGLLASPAVADDVLPTGCVGSYAYLCTNDATPPDTSPYADPQRLSTIELVEVSPVAVVPGMTVGGQVVQSVVVVVGGQTLPGVSQSVDTSVDPTYTGVAVPVNACLLVTCLQAGQPIVLPGVTGPVVPVYVPPTTVPQETVTTPAVGPVPSTTTPSVSTPRVDQPVGVVRVYVGHGDLYDVATFVCRLGGGSVSYDGFAGRYACYGGDTAAVANALFVVATLGDRAW